MKNIMKSIGKRIAVLLTLSVMTLGSLQAQVFIMDEDVGGNIRVGGSEFSVPVPYQGTDLDEYLPLGNGVWLLIALGGAYLLRKRKDEKAK